MVNYLTYSSNRQMYDIPLSGAKNPVQLSGYAHLHEAYQVVLDHWHSLGIPLGLYNKLVSHFR